MKLRGTITKAEGVGARVRVTVDCAVETTSHKTCYEAVVDVDRHLAKGYHVGRDVEISIRPVVKR